MSASATPALEPLASPRMVTSDATRQELEGRISYSIGEIALLLQTIGDFDQPEFTQSARSLALANLRAVLAMRVFDLDRLEALLEKATA
jgi:hypothetical protein